MSNSVSQFPSDKWIPYVVNMCFEFLKTMSKHHGGRFLAFRDELLGSIERPGKIVKEYHETASKLKQRIYGEKADHEKIDHHKIAALYIRSFLKYQLFCFDIPEETKNYKTCYYTELANEYFIIDYMEAIFKAANNDFDGELQMDPDYKVDFIKLLYSYKKDISKLDPLALADIICLIEKQYFIHGKPGRVKKPSS